MHACLSFSQASETNVLRHEIKELQHPSTCIIIARVCCFGVVDWSGVATILQMPSRYPEYKTYSCSSVAKH